MREKTALTPDQVGKRRRLGLRIGAFTGTAILLVVLTLVSTTVGSLNVSLAELVHGLASGGDEAVRTVMDVRLPRIIIALFAGAALAVSGTLLQAVMKNPLTDPGIIGISSASALVGSLVTAIFPSLFFGVPLLSILGGLFAYLAIYSLAWDGGVHPTRLILVGVALNMTFTGIGQAVTAAFGGGVNMTGIQSIVSGHIAQKTWDDVRLLVIYVGITLVVALFSARVCNLLALDDKTARGLGIAVDRNRFWVALIAIILAAITSSTVGIVGFLGLLVPHIARLLVGSDHKVLIPYAILLGALFMLASDTIGRAIFYPYEVPAAVIMAVVGGPFFIALLKIGGQTDEY
ncbi:FecCD family ABC transporter permease [Peptococcus simiae]|uniref:FecCD family ABC transporter permease n=1 Tax=Peptococcus simiae TaxID=1643805 RepID=UPI003980D124